jgi:CubicO group peptidase (beta-lactamase class C family)
VDESVPRSFAPVVELLQEGVGRAYPGAVLAVLFRDEVVARIAVGWATGTPAPYPARLDTVYDLASLTKVVATTPLVLMAAGEGLLGLDDPLPRHVPECPHGEVTVRHLLAHTAGFPAWVPFYLNATGYDAIVRRAAAVPLVSPPGESTLYSDVGFILLGEVVRRRLGPLDRQASARIFRPLGMRDTLFRPPPELRSRIAPTEDGAQVEREMAGPAGRRYPWRRSLIWGEVHDSTAYAMGGVSGHAGLFGTAQDLIAYTRMWLAEGSAPHGPRLPPALVREALSPQDPSRSRGLGWALAGPGAWWGGCLSPDAYGHTGFTGTALVVDPGHRLAIVLLTNSVHLGRDRTGIAEFRQRVACAVARALV